MKKNQFLLLLLLVLSFLVQAQVKSKEALKGFDKFVEKTMKDWNVQGVGIGIVQDGKVVLTKGYGYKNVEKKEKTTENTLFAIGSSSKAFTAASVMQLADEDLIELDEPVVEQMPEFKLYDDYATQNITPRDLLCHNSGLPRHDFAWYGSDRSRKELIEALQYLEPTAELRQTWQYQNLMYMSAGYLVEKASGNTWEKQVKIRILNPLGMKNTNFSVDEMQKTADYSLPYQEKDGKVEVMPFRNIDAVGPAGSINSNAVDMCQWLKLQLANGAFDGEEIIKESSVKQMHSPHEVIPGGYKYDESFYSTYGLGWMITNYRGNLSVHHGGNIDGFSAMVALMPRQDFGVVILTNMNGTPLTSIIRNNVYDRFLGMKEVDWNDRVLETMKKGEEDAEENKEEEEDIIQKKGTKPSHDLADYIGTYEHGGYGALKILKGEKAALRLQFNGFDVPLEHYHYDVFQVGESIIEGQKLVFYTNKDGDINKVSSGLETGTDDIEFKRVVEIKALAKDILEIYAGEYEMSGVVATVAIVDNALNLTIPGQPTYTLEAIKEHTFNIKDLEGYSVIFKVKEGKSEAVIFNQPNGVFTIPRKK